MEKYSYNFYDFINAYDSNKEFPHGLNFSVLQNEIAKSNIGETILYINSTFIDATGLVDFFFENSLSSSDKNLLDELVTNHTGIVTNIEDITEFGSSRDIYFIFGNYNSDKNYWESQVETWEVCRSFLFPGSEKIGIPDVFSALAFIEDSDYHGYIRLYDITNNSVLSFIEVDSKNVQLFIGVVNNVPENQAILQIQTKTDKRKKSIFLNSITIHFE